MKLNEYQELLKNYDNYPKELGPFYLILGVQSSVGKLSEKLRILLNQDSVDISDQDKVSLSISMGDVLYNLITIANSLNIPFENIASLSLRKLSMLKEKRLNENITQIKKEDNK